ncbi:F-box-like domain-containing protein [Microdochium nivale]|nr:F-box-like domain-containing protein [Microdochium nivale]
MPFWGSWNRPTATAAEEAASVRAAASASAVLAVPELLLEILSSIDDVRTLLLVQRVSRSWHAAIVGSAELQEQLFFRPIIARTAEDMTSLATRRVNPLLEARFPTFFPPHKTPEAGGSYNLNEIAGLRRGQNPFGFMNGRGSPWGRAARREAYLRRDASWRRMLVQQPAAMKLGHIEDQGPGQRAYWKAVIDCSTEQGLRMAKLYDLVYQHAGSRSSGARGDFTVYRRVPAYDPPLTQYSARGGAEEVALSLLEPDVAFVVLRSTAGEDYVSVNDTADAQMLMPGFLPEGWKPTRLDLKVTNVHDWFG